MNVCEQCGSASRDKSGICAGCGAAWPLAMPAVQANRGGSQQLSAYARLPGLVEVRPKKIWLAVSLALLCGPIGLLYCTTTGTIVMLIASIILAIWWGKVSSLLILPVCAAWAWIAARESSSTFD